ncbi:MAG: hypothetical protein AAF916_11945, partial [Planctomycetota bacterium]
GSELDPASDTVVLETVYEYDDADRVIATATLARKADADVHLDVGRLWTPGLPRPIQDGQPTSFARPSYAATWYDQAGRVEAVADYGDDTGP